MPQHRADTRSIPVPERVDAANKAWGDLYQTGKQIESLVKEGKNDETRAQRACGNW